MKEAHKLIENIDKIKREDLESDSLLNGKLGLVYYYLCLYKVFNKEDHLQRIEKNLESIFTNIEKGVSSLMYDSTLENGLSGLGYVLQLLIEEKIIDEGYSSQLEEINNIVVDQAIELIQNNNYDFVRGPFGILFYLNYVDSKPHVNRVLEALFEKLKEDKNFLFYNEYTYIEGVHIGYAHGVCAIIKVLNDINDERAEYFVRYLLDKLINIMKKNEYQIIKDKKYYLPRSIHKGDEFEKGLNYRAVLAWSNSDVNFSTLIYSLNEKFKTNELLTIANKIALESLEKREEKHTRIWDHRFYFGSSGVLKTYMFLYKKTRNSKYKEASNFWYKKTLNLLTESAIKEHPLNFLNNLPATALSLLEFEREEEFNWSKILLL